MESTQTIRVFVYGTLKPGHANWTRLLRGRVRHFRAAKVRGQLLALPQGLPAAVPGEGWIYGYLLTLPAPDLLERIDALEGFHPRRPPERNTYLRTRRPCFSPSGTSLGQVYAYFMDPARAFRMGGERVAAESWRPLLRAGGAS